MTLENLTKASQSLAMATADLQQALHTADAVESLLILPMIRDAVQLADAINAMTEAMRATEEG
jgi:hypothetical protein